MAARFNGGRKKKDRFEVVPEDELSGRDPANKEPVSFVIIETGYDESRAGTRDEQLAALRGVQADHPAVRSARPFESGVLANRYSDEARPQWRDTYVRPVELEPDRDGCVPYADVSVDGRADVDNSPVGLVNVSRRLVG